MVSALRSRGREQPGVRLLLPCASALRRAGRSIGRRAWARRFALLGTLLLGAGTAVRSFVFTLQVIGRHHRLLRVWWVPGDIWGTLRDGQMIAWLDFGHLYQAGTAMVTLPGTALLLAPVAAVVNAFGLVTDFPFAVPHPSAWLVLGPWAVAVSGIALVALDALAERLGVGPAKRAALGVAGAAVLFPVVGWWGHPEDAVAVGLFLFALLAAVDRRPVAAGWLTGVALAVQPLVVLGVPVLLGALGGAFLGRGSFGGRLCWPFIVRAALPSLVLLAPVLAAAPHATLHALLDQPNFPGVDHPTPWTALAPHLGGHGKDLAVAAGPGRLVAVVGAGGLWPLASRWRGRPARLAALVAVALELRCLTESVMDPYYLWPALAVSVVLGATAGWRWLVVLALGALAVSVVAELPLGWVAWWTLSVLGGAAVVAGSVAVLWRALCPAVQPGGGGEFPGERLLAPGLVAAGAAGFAAFDRPGRPRAGSAVAGELPVD
jgi:hypothetical protein